MIAWEVFIVGLIIFFIMSYSGRVSTNKFIDDNRDFFFKIKESDYDFLVMAKYGEGVDPNVLFAKRIKNGILIFGVVMFVFISSLSYKNIIFAAIAAYVTYKLDYSNLKTYYKKHLHDIDILLPYYLKGLEILIQHYTIPVAIGKSIDDSPEIFKPGLKTMIERINAGDSTIEPYMEFARNYPVRDSMRMMRLLYRLSLGRQERKQDQLLSFSKTISNLQNKARETKYKERLDKMEGKTMSMLITTGVGLMVLIILSVLLAFNM